MGNNRVVCTMEDNSGAHGLIFPGVFSLTLRTPNGMEQNSVAYIPSEKVYKHYLDKAAKACLQIEIKVINESNDQNSEN